jgi:hypothetical protein
MAVVLAGIGFVIVLLGKLPVTLWLGTQLLIFSTALFFGLLAVFAGLVAQRPQSAFVFLLLFFFIQFPSFAMPKFLLTNFLLPVFGIANLFRDDGRSGDYNPVGDWNGLPELFGLSDSVKPDFANRHRDFSLARGHPQNGKSISAADTALGSRGHLGNSAGCATWFNLGFVAWTIPSRTLPARK